MKYFAIILSIFFLFNCSTQTSINEGCRIHHPDEFSPVVIRDGNSNLPHVIKTNNFNEELLELYSQGFRLLERVEKSTSVDQLIAHALHIEAPVLVYQVEYRDGNSDGNRNQSYIPPRSTTNGTAGFISIPNERVKINSSRSGEQAKQAAFLVRYE